MRGVVCEPFRRFQQQLRLAQLGDWRVLTPLADCAASDAEVIGELGIAGQSQAVSCNTFGDLHSISLAPYSALSSALNAFRHSLAA